MLDRCRRTAIGERDPVDHHVGPLLGVAKVEVLDLHAGRQQVDKQRVVHDFLRFDLQPHDQGIAFLQRAAFPRLAVGRVIAAHDADLAVVGRRHRTGHAGDIDQRIQRRLALRRETHALAQRSRIEIAAPDFLRPDRLHAAADRERARHLCVRIADQGLAKRGQCDLLLRAQPLPARIELRFRIARQAQDACVVLGLGEFEAMAQGHHHRQVAQVRAVVAQIPRTLGFHRERFGYRLAAAVVVAHQVQRNPQVHQRQRRERLAAFVIVQRAQGTQRRTIHPCEHIAGIGVACEPQRVGVLVTVETLPAGEQVFVEPLQRFLQHRLGYLEAAIARVEQELGDVRRELRRGLAVAAPHREMPGRDLHRRQSSQRTFDAMLALDIGQAGHAELLRGVGIQQQCSPAFAGGLLGAAVWIFQQVRKRAGERQRRQRGQREPCIDRVRHHADRIAALESHRPQRVERDRARSHDCRPRRAHSQFIAAFDAETIGHRSDGVMADALPLQCAQRETQGALGAILEHDLARAAVEFERRIGLGADGELMRRASEVLQIERHRARIAGGERARRTDLGHDRCAHQRLGVGLAVAIGREHHRRHAQRAIELRQPDVDARDTLGVHRHRAGEQIDRLHMRGRSSRLRQRPQRHVAAEA